jgi:NDP-sugar pyrophosphorylase family protein
MKRAIILAGGRGERLRPLTQDRPKCMIEVLGSPILSYQLRWLSAYGVKKVAVACGYLNEMIQSYFGNGVKFGLDIEYVVEDKPLGRGGALKQALKQTIEDEQEVLCLNGDNICNLVLPDFEKFHQQHKPLATILTTPLRSPYGIVETTPEGDITAFSEKPVLPYGVNAGIYIMNRAIIEKLPDIGDHEETTFPTLAKDGKLKAFNSDCFWRTVDTVKDVNELRNELEGMLMGAFLHIR